MYFLLLLIISIKIRINLIIFHIIILLKIITPMAIIISHILIKYLPKHIIYYW